jgi:hypothetical protein
MVGRFYGAQGHIPYMINAGLRPVTRLLSLNAGI